MKNQIFGISATSAAVALLVPSVAGAEVSALDVWNSWKTYAETSGQTVDVGSQQTEGNALILRDVQMSVALPDGSVSSTIDLMEFRERGDGTVAITMSPDLPLSMSFSADEGEEVDLALIFRQTGLSIIASGDPDDISFDYLAAKVEMDLDKLVVDGEDVAATINLSLNDIDGGHSLRRGDATGYSSDLSAGTLNYTVSVADPESDGRLDISGTAANLQATSDVQIPAGLDMADSSALFTGGFAAEGRFGTGASSSSTTIVDQGQEMRIASSTQSTQLDFAIAGGSVEYGVGAQGVSYTLQSTQIPFPEIDLKLAEVAFRFLTPMVKSDDARDFGAEFRLAGLEISDMIWQMFDSGGIMPRDPVTLALGVAGKMRWLVDITDPQAAEMFEGEAPAEIENLEISEFTLSGFGAEITGGGNFTFDNADLETFDGIPAPTGAINLQLVGINGLLDRLIQMGLLPDDQAMGVRMMLGLFARPAGGEDTMESTIEIKGDGSVFANGQQLK